MQLTLLSLSLLGLVPAAIASASLAPHHDCCPESQHAPCQSGGGSSPAVPNEASCCAVVPAPLSAVTEVVSARTRAEFFPVVSPDLFSLPASRPHTADTIALNLPAYFAVSRFSRPSEPIYLLTRRLRL